MAKEYFMYDPRGNGYAEFDTLEEAKKEAESAIDYYLDDGWDEEVMNVVYGKITHRATQTDLINRPPDNKIDEDGNDEEGNYWDADWDYRCNYKMLPISPPKASITRA